MKTRLFALTIAIAILFSGCSLRREIRVGDRSDLVLDYCRPMGNFCISVEDGVCYVYVLYYDTIAGIVIFSENREILELDHVKVICCDEMSVFLNKTVEELEAELGEVYGLIGGFSSPAYVTDDGYILWMRLTEMYPNGTVSAVVKIDLFSGEIVQKT